MRKDMGLPEDEIATSALLSLQLLQMGLDGDETSEVLRALAGGLNRHGLSIARIHVSHRANHPEFGSTAHRWVREEGTHQEHFERRPTPLARWTDSPLFHLLTLDQSELRQRLNDPEPKFDFPFFDELRERGCTDYALFKRLFNRHEGTLAVDPLKPPEGTMISFTTDAPDGFTDEGLNMIRALLPAAMLALKSNANRQMAKDIAATYIGRDAGARVLSGDIIRGSVQHIDAVICYFDLSGFTKLSEELAGEEVVEMLNDYFGMAVEVVQAHGGNVLKFMGDGMLAIFNVDRTEDPNIAAVKATVALREEMALINKARGEKGLRTTGFTLALHRGEVLYGNIGGKTRLDFTVIGPAVNTAARLSGMCAHVDQNIVISAEVARPILAQRNDLVSLGQYRLRGVAARQELFTLD